MLDTSISVQIRGQQHVFVFATETIIVIDIHVGRTRMDIALISA